MCLMLHGITHQGCSSITRLFLLFLPLLFVLVTTTVFVCTIVSASLLVLTALLVTVIVCLMVGLLLFVTAIVIFVFGEPISDMPTLAPVCWDKRKARPVPRPMNAGIAGIKRALKRLLLLKVLTGLGLGINSCLFSILGGCSLIGDL